MRRIVIAAVLCVVSASMARAQFSLGLPRVDAINVFYRAARFSSSSGWEGVPAAPCSHSWKHTPACGWGFETMYDLTTDKQAVKPDEVFAIRRLEAARLMEVSALREEADAMERQAATMQPADAERIRAQAHAKRAQAAEKELEVNKLDKEADDLQKRVAVRQSPFGAELAVGYDYVNVHAHPRSGGKYDILGSIQTLPSITLYASWDISDSNALYAGLGTGFVVLKNMRAYDALGAPYAISADTWGFTPSVGWSRHFLSETTARPGVYGFLELSYEVRQFPSLTYALPSGVTTLPADLPRSLAANGFVFNVGLEIRLPKSEKK
jgi:hypothetical protein